MSQVKIDRKARMKLPHQPLPERDPAERIHDFLEISPGYSPEAARAEAERCIHCPDPAPCVRACPLDNPIPQALWEIEHGNFIEAAELFRSTNPMPEICGRVCPVEPLCREACVVGKRGEPVAITPLERFVADYQREMVGVPLPRKAPPTGKRVAVVGAGPAGLAVAERLTIAGHDVVVYDAWPYPGGLLTYGLPSFKLSKAIVRWKIEWLQELGVTFVTNIRIGEALTVDDLLDREGFDAVFLGTGAGVDAHLNVPGEDLEGVYHATPFLVRANTPPDLLPRKMRARPAVGRRVAIIGGGDTAMDCARTAMRLGAEEVTVLYRRTEAEMPAIPEERLHAREEGVQFEYLTAPTRFIGDEEGRLVAMECVRMELGEPDASGRRRPIPITGSEFILEVDTVVLALGYWPDPLIGETTPGLETRKWGLIVADEETGRTSREGVFAGGDNIRGPDLVVTALADGVRAAEAIDAYLQGQRMETVEEEIPEPA